MIVRPGETSEEVIANFGKMRVKRLLRELRTLSLEKFKKYYDGQYEIKEVKPPLDGVAYYSAYEYRHIPCLSLMHLLGCSGTEMAILWGLC